MSNIDYLIPFTLICLTVFLLGLDTFHGNMFGTVTAYLSIMKIGQLIIKYRL